MQEIKRYRVILPLSRAAHNFIQRCKLFQKVRFSGSRETDPGKTRGGRGLKQNGPNGQNRRDNKALGSIDIVVIKTGRQAVD